MQSTTKTQTGFSKVLIGFCIAILIIIGLMILRSNIIKPGSNLGLVFGFWKPSTTIYPNCPEGAYGERYYYCEGGMRLGLATTVLPKDPECKDPNACNGVAIQNSSKPAGYCTYATVTISRRAMPPNSTETSPDVYKAVYSIKKPNGDVSNSGITDIIPSTPRPASGSSACNQMHQGQNGNETMKEWLEKMI